MPMLRLLGCIFWTALLVLPSVAPAATVAKRQFELRGGSKVHEYVLPNGLTLMVIEKLDAPLTSIYHWVKAGGLHELPGTTGIAHLFEHLMFRPLAPGDVSFDEKASGFGAEVDATTHVDSTVYVTTVPKEQVEAVLQAEAARFKGMQVTDQLLDVEREVVRSEYQTRIAASAVGTLYRSLYTRAFPGRSAFGLPEDLDKIQASDCNAFFAKYYRPNNTGLVVGGAVSAAEVVRWVEANYGEWQPGPEVTPQVFFSGQGAEMIEGQLASPARTVAFGFRVPLYDRLEPQAIRLLNWILFESSYSLAMRRLSDDQNLATQVGDFGFAGDNGMLKGIANVLPGVSLQQMQRELGKLGTDFRRLSDAEYQAYVQEFFIGAQERAQRNRELAAAAAQSWGKYGSLDHLVTMLAGQPVPDLRSKVTSIVDQYIKADNLLLAHGKGDK